MKHRARMKPLPFFATFVLSLCCATAATPRLKVSDNKRFLTTTDGKPFFYLGDTAWELFHRLNREEADQSLAPPQRLPAGAALPYLAYKKAAVKRRPLEGENMR